jgi:hypothetical protein
VLKENLTCFWPETISNEYLWQIAKEKPIIRQNKEGEWQWRGRSLRKGSQATERQPLREDVREEDLRGHGGERYKKRLGKRKIPGKKLEPWPKAGSAGDASWKPCAPEEVTR